MRRDKRGAELTNNHKKPQVKGTTTTTNRKKRQETIGNTREHIYKHNYGLVFHVVRALGNYQIRTKGNQQSLLLRVSSLKIPIFECFWKSPSLKRGRFTSQLVMVKIRNCIAAGMENLILSSCTRCKHIPIGKKCSSYICACTYLHLSLYVHIYI